MKITDSYSTGSKILHWLIAILVILMLAGGFFLEDLPESIRGTAISIHKSVGLSIIVLMLIRILWLFSHKRPKLPATVPAWQKALARMVQGFLYIFLLLMPITGWIMSVAAGRTPVYFGLFRLPLPIEPSKSLADTFFEAHEIIAYILIALSLIHIAAAFMHYWISKDGVMESMLFRRKSAEPLAAPKK